MFALTLEQVERFIKQQENSKNRDIRICTMISASRREYFFTDGHGYMHSNLLPGDWTPVSGYLPMKVVPRPGLEDGIIVTLDQYIAVFYSNMKLVDPLKLSK